MKQKTFARAEVERMAPLLQSMTLEIQERPREVASLERRLARLEGRRSPEALAEYGQLRSELSTQGRELRLVRKEVERLGLAVSDSRPPRIVVPGDEGDWIYGSLDDTNFFRLEESRA